MNNFLKGEKGATFSQCSQYRYALWRRWDKDKPTVMFIMLNPSKADAEVNDPTLEKCLRFSESWGYGSLLVGNLFAWKATCPGELRLADDPVGPLNDAALHDMAAAADLVVAAWGNHGSLWGRSRAVQRMFAGRLHYLRCTKAREPSHPLYLPGDLQPVWKRFWFLHKSDLEP